MSGFRAVALTRDAIENACKWHEMEMVELAGKVDAIKAAKIAPAA